MSSPHATAALPTNQSDMVHEHIKGMRAICSKVLIGPTPITRVGVNEVHCKLIHDKILDSHLVQPLQVAQYFLIIPPTHLQKKHQAPTKHHPMCYTDCITCFLQQTGPQSTIFRVRFITSRRIRDLM